MHLIY